MNKSKYSPERTLNKELETKECSEPGDAVSVRGISGQRSGFGSLYWAMTTLHRSSPFVKALSRSLF